MPRARRAIPFLLFWAALTAAATLLLRAARRESGADAGTLLDAATPLINVVQCVAAPGRIVAYITRVIWRWPAWQVDAASLALGFGALLLALLAANRVRLRLAGAGPMRTSPETTDAPPNPSRRRLLVNGACAAGSLAAAGAAVSAVMIEPQRLALRRYRIPIAQLPRELDGLRIAFLSDTHLGPLIPASHIQRTIDEALALNPDLFLLGGDYVYSFPSPMPRAVDLFRPLVARGKPVLAVLGNHDWYDNPAGIAAHLREIGARVIDNTRVFFDARTRTITDSSAADAPALCIVGLGDLIAGNVRSDRAFAGIPEGMPRILLAHEPDTFELPELAGPRAPRIDLALCGHTHGGQVCLPFIGAPVTCSQFGQKYLGGVAQGPRCPVITSRGVGMSGLPVRFGVPPEVVEVTLTS